MEEVTAAIYVRQSLDREGNRLAVSRQIEACEGLCKSRGWKIYRPILEDNDRSATYGERKDYQKLLRLIKRGAINVVVVWAVDRLTRKLTDLEEIIDLAEEHDVKIVTVTGDLDLSGPMGRLLARIMASVARNEAEQKGLRHKAANLQAAIEGKPHISRRAFGYNGTSELTINETEAPVLKQMAEHFINGWSYKEIAYWLNEQGFTTAERKPWHPITVRNTLRRPLYAGIRVHHGVEYPGNWPPIFDPDTWDKIRLTESLRLERVGNKPKPRKYLLTRKANCGRCGNYLNGETKRDHPGRPLRRVYVCRVQGDTQRQGGCGGVTRNAVALEAYVRDEAIALMESLSESRHAPEDVRELSANRQALLTKLDSLLDDYTDGTLTKAEYVKAKRRVEESLATMEHEIEWSIHRDGISVALKSGYSIRDQWETNSDGWRRKLIDMAFKGVIVMPGKSKPFVMIDGVKMRFDKSLVRLVRR